jgi:predicted RecB family endonuclease
MDAGFARIGFRIRQSKVREVDGRRWVETDHDLDRLVERDGIRYGVEIKNQLGYIEQTEFKTKLAMCEFFDVRPMFVARMMPKNYISDVARAGGFSLIFANQHYPLMSDNLARRVRERLQLPVLSIRELPDTTLSRFEDWHMRKVKR